MNAIASYWRSRPARERSALTAGIVVAAVMLVIAMVWIPLERTRQRLAAELPALRASVASLEAQAAEVAKLRATPSTIPPNPSPLAPLMAANAWARELPGVQLAVPDEKHVRLKADDVAFTALLEWLTNAMAAHGLRVETAHIESLAAPGRVRAELTLARR